MNRKLEAIALAGIIAVGCARPTDATAQPTPVPTKNFPEFTLAPIPTPTLTPRPTEKPIIEGWPRARSTIYPYEISYPPGWLTTRNNAEDKYTSTDRVGNYQTSVAISSATVDSFVRLTDYAANVQNQLTQNIRMIREASKTSGPPVGSINTNIAGQDAIMLSGRIPPYFLDPDSEVRIGIFIADGRVWQIVLQSATVAIGTEEPKFQKMISSFSFIK